MTAIAPEKTVVASADVVAADVGGERLLLNLDTGLYHGMNPVGTRIFELIDEPQTVEAVAAAIEEEYDIESEVAAADVREYVETLVDAGLAEVTETA
ncbi:coenzyme pqq synthesis protein d (pqqd) [Halogeometricum borinquense DSM 11551]|uniref:Coenzyme PQQ synthesis protein D (PqqD) n=2 Tax=Halogeometricum borinquense TaxID=60847 RepID=E4NR19_HALBP|nr:PqqD family protein [Halogeometricum borinquense]ADQ66755.1 Coenzyme PQQ synthesis protein D (PqqD) [Halogeometricum borinquense DSM 11551]ELY30264.1 coenzyme pqq synthesis protein d (pqqd) [Halogeometricum borinquense DSM 11551]RYJ14271.1 PqqD family protein [Halogeometricum borinquense]